MFDMEDNIITFVRDFPVISRYYDNILSVVSAELRQDKLDWPGNDGIYIQRVVESPIHLIMLSNPI